MSTAITTIFPVNQSSFHIRLTILVIDTVLVLMIILNVKSVEFVKNFFLNIAQHFEKFLTPDPLNFQRLKDQLIE